MIGTMVEPARADAGLANTTVLIVRHAEKPDQGPGLTPIGEKRAAAYVSYFQSLADGGRSLQPQTLIATADSEQSMRPGLTLKPLSEALHLPLDQRFKDEDYQSVVGALRTETHGRVVLIAWHHGKIAKLISAFGADPKALLPSGKWPEQTYDWVIELPFDANGHLRTDQAKRLTETDIDRAIAQAAGGN